MYKAVGKEVKRAFSKNRILKVLHDSIGAGPFDGGCLIVAKALLHYVPECELGTLVREFQDGDIVPDHFVLLCPDGGCIDADGYAESPEALVERFVRTEGFHWKASKTEIKRGIVTPHCIPDDARTVKDLARVLRGCLAERSLGPALG